MNRSIFWRVFWKEYRLQRALWIAKAALTVLVLLFVDALVIHHSTDRIVILYGLATTLSAFYCLGCGAVLFAGEQEAGTFEFQRSQPVGAGRVFAAKLAFALLSIAALLGSTWLVAYCLSGGLPFGIAQADSWVTGMCAWGAAMLLWAMLFSLVLKRVLVAAVLGVAAASLHLAVIDKLGIAVVALAVMAVNCWLGIRWFRERWNRSLRTASADLADKSSAQAAARLGRSMMPQRTAIFGRLVWAHWRQSIGLMSALVAVIVVLAAVPEGLLLFGSGQFDLSEYFGKEGVNQKPLYVVALALVPLLAACAFMPDQWGRGYRFMTDRGVPPKYIWWSRQLVTLVPIAIVLPVLLYFAFYLAPEQWVPGRNEMVRHPWTAVTYVAGYVILAFAVGQFCSMCFRSSVLAGLFGVFGSVLLAGWWGAMLFWGVPWFWSVMPIPLVLLVATRLRTRDWLLERNSPRTWLLPGLVLGVSLVAIMTAVPLYRIYQIPEVDPVFPVAACERPMTPEERNTLDLYERAFRFPASENDSSTPTETLN